MFSSANALYFFMCDNDLFKMDRVADIQRIYRPPSFSHPLQIILFIARLGYY